MSRIAGWTKGEASIRKLLSRNDLRYWEIPLREYVRALKRMGLYDEFARAFPHHVKMMEASMPDPDKIATCLWFESGSVEAAEFYVSVFPDSEILDISRVSAGPAAGNAFVVFSLADRTFQAIDGGPMFKITPAISFVVNCADQPEIDRYWGALAEGGEEGYCGWLTDRFGVSWQVVPAYMGDLMRANSKGVMDALLTMRKVDLGALNVAATKTA